MSESNLLSDFKLKCNNILKTAVGFFEENANQYQGAVFNKVMKEVLSQLF